MKRALAFVVVTVLTGLTASTARAAEIPAAVADIETMSRDALAALPDVKVELGKPLPSLDGKSMVALKLMRNSIYAQYGIPFKTRWLRDYFETRSWYHAQAKAEKAVAGVDLDNARAILAREQALAPKVPALTVDHIVLMNEAQLKQLSDYQLPLGKPVDVDAIGKLSLMELKLMRNSIFAQRGKGDFTTPWLINYFKTRTWFHPKAKPDALDAVDIANVAALKALEDKLAPKGDKAVLDVLATEYCEREIGDVSPERLGFFPDGRLVIVHLLNGGYPGNYDTEETAGEWRVTGGHLETRRATPALTPWKLLELDSALHLCH